MDSCPMPPDATPDDSLEIRQWKLQRMYQNFALELHEGMLLTQLTSVTNYSWTHCQLMEDTTTLKLDHSDGRIIEFPLFSANKVYRMIKYGDLWRGVSVPGRPEDAEEVVVVEFLKPKIDLAFVFSEPSAAQRFLICMGLLVQRAQQVQPEDPLSRDDKIWDPLIDGPLTSMRELLVQRHRTESGERRQQ